MKEEEHLLNQCWGPNVFFGFLDVRPFSPGGFLTFSVALVLCPPCVLITYSLYSPIMLLLLCKKYIRPVYLLHFAIAKVD